MNLVVTCLTMGTLVVFSTEGLSLFHALTFLFLLLFWLVVLGILFYWLRSLPRQPAVPLRSFFMDLSLWDKGLLLGIVLLLAATLLTGITAPPNNLDAMAYHMTRVKEWEQNASIDFFPTYELRENELQPLAEYMILHAQVLSGTDRFANLVQWFFYLACLAAVSLIAQDLGASKRGQVYTAVFAATLPMAVLQASNAQNDLVAAFGLLSVILFGIRFGKEPGGWSATLWGLSLGFATLTKGTNWIYALPFGLYFFGEKIWSGHRRIVEHGLILAGILLAFNAGYCTRNIVHCGHPMGSDRLHHFVWNAEFTPPIALSNAMRTLAMHLNVPPTLQRPMDEVMSAAHRLIGLENDDPRSTLKLHLMIGKYLHEKEMPVPYFRFHWPGIDNRMVSDDWAGNPFHLLLIFVCFAYTLWAVDLHHLRMRRILLACIFFAFAISCLLLRWQPIVSRLQIPLFMGFAPLVGLMLEETRRGIVASACVFFLLLFAFYPALENYRRPLIGPRNIFNISRDDLYFFRLKDGKKTDFYRARDIVQENRFQKIGLIDYLDNYQYPFWALFQKKNPIKVEIRHMLLEEDIRFLGGKNGWMPEVVVSLGYIDKDNIFVNAVRYVPVMTTPRVQVFVPEGTKTVPFLPRQDQTALPLSEETQEEE
ncbi:MAG: hypothetical protein V1918_04730 [Planctomycetota bacterium]